MKINWKGIIAILLVIVGKVAESILKNEREEKKARKYVDDYIKELTEEQE